MTYEVLKRSADPYDGSLHGLLKSSETKPFFSVFELDPDQSGVGFDYLEESLINYFFPGGSITNRVHPHDMADRTVVNLADHLQTAIGEHLICVVGPDQRDTRGALGEYAPYLIFPMDHLNDAQVKSVHRQFLDIAYRRLDTLDVDQIRSLR